MLGLLYSDYETLGTVGDLRFQIRSRIAPTIVSVDWHIDIEAEILLSMASMAFIFLTKALPQGTFRVKWEQINYLDQRKRSMSSPSVTSSCLCLNTISSP